METAVLIVVLVAAGVLVASGIWVGLVLIEAVTRIKHPAAKTAHETPGGNPLASGPDSGPGPA